MRFCVIKGALCLASRDCGPIVNRRRFSNVQYFSRMLLPTHNAFNDNVFDSNITSISQSLLQSHGCVTSPTPGAFNILPYAHRALHKLCRLIDKEMERIDAQKVMMPSLINASLLKRSGRFESCEQELFTLKDNLILAPTYEEVVTQLVSAIPGMQWKQLPLYIYQISTKFRKEKRPKSGILRAREFLMKDLYTFDVDEEAARETYAKVSAAYERIFALLELPVVKVEACTGEIGGQFSHEYHLLAEIGEDSLLWCEKCEHAESVEFAATSRQTTSKCAKCDGQVISRKGIEVGHTFLLGTRYSQPFDATFIAKDGKRNLLMMGCYGLGVSRLIAAALEVLSRKHRMRWPCRIRPFDLAVMLSKDGSKEALAGGSDFLEAFIRLITARHENLDVLVDDRNNLTLGRRRKDHEMRGVPYTLLAGRRFLEDVPRLELVDGQSGESLDLTHLEALDEVARIASATDACK